VYAVDAVDAVDAVEPDVAGSAGHRQGGSRFG
jgi:hypothetical protein